ncbi:TPA: hypothetical protein SMF87_004532 [Serratia marcescens]|nr:hypothetical protein [Serratia marcescens]
MMKAYRFDQIQLVAAITQELSRQHPGLPADHRMNAVIQAANRIIAEYERQPVMATDRMGLRAWLDSDDIGSSSIFMAFTLATHEQRQRHFRGRGKPSNNYPRDPDDLGRCIRLIDAVPEFGGRIPEMADKGAHWMAVTTNWDRWCTLHARQNYALLHSEMREAFAKAGEK